MHDCSRIHRLAHTKCRLEAHLVGGGDSGFVQTVTQARTTRFTCSVPLALKHHFQQNFAFQLQIASFVGIDWLRFKCNFHRSSRWPICLRDFGPVNHLLRSESASCNPGPAAAAIAFAAGRDAVAEIRAGHRSLQCLLPRPTRCLVPDLPACQTPSLRRIQLGALLARCPSNHWDRRSRRSALLQLTPSAWERPNCLRSLPYAKVADAPRPR